MTKDNDARTGRRLNRRLFLQASAGTALAGAALPPALASAGVDPAALDAQGLAPNEDVFRHSVASGDPMADSVVIWTRVTPDPAALPGSGLGAATKVRWEVATDPSFGEMAATGESLTGAGSDHTVKVEVTGLAPATTYFYRFFTIDGPTGGAVSRTGRTKTAPAAGTNPGRVRFATVSCSNYEAGFFRGYRDIADRDDIEFVLHLGDYTYEYQSGEYGGVYGTTVRTVEPPQRTTTLADFRIRQGHYHLDADLADMHAAKPIIAMWDDHEFSDNWWREGVTGNSWEEGDDFDAVQSAAMQAYFEWMPVRVNNRNEHLYRTLRYGDLFDLIIPDLRTYRDIQMSLTGDGLEGIREVARDGRTMMGPDQLGWFQQQVASSTTQWQLIGTSVMFAPLTLPHNLDPRLHEWLVTQIGLPDDGIPLNMDQWDGYMVERHKIITDLTGQGKNSVVFLTGDIHTGWANDIPVRPDTYRRNNGGPVAATEFVTPSITAGSAYDTIAARRELKGVADTLIGTGEQLIKGIDPWFKYVDLHHHGYLTVEVTEERTQCDFHNVDDVLTPDTPFSVAASFQALAGQPGAVPAPGALDRAQAAY